MIDRKYCKSCSEFFSGKLCPRCCASDGAFHYRSPKDRARKDVEVAVRNGTLDKADHCLICGKIGTVEGHHQDYEKPLGVLWVCRQCHSKLPVI